MLVKTIFVTNRDDISVEYLIDKFRPFEKDYLRLNSEDIDLLQFEYSPSGSSLCFLDDTELIYLKSKQLYLNAHLSNITIPKATITMPT